MSSQSLANKSFGFLSLAVFVVKIVLNYLSGRAIYPFPNSQGNVSNYFYLEITPAGWAFSIWGVIYTLNAGYIIYAITTLFRPVPVIFTSRFFLVYIFTDIANVAWLFAFSNEEVGWSCVAIIAYQLGLYGTLVIVYRNYHAHQKQLETAYPKDAWATRILAQNGIMMNAAWVTIAALLNIAMVCTYKWGATNSFSCNLALSILLVETLLWFYLENWPIQSYLNFTYLDWPVVLWALSASLAKNWDPDKTSSKFSLALIIIAAIAFIARITLQVLRAKTVSCNRGQKV